MNSDRKKELKDAYKNKPVIGGICRISCVGSERSWIQATRDIDSFRNRFNFALATKGCPDPSMRAEWLEHGSEAFSFEVLEELKKGEDQTDKEFLNDLNTLRELWLEKTKQAE